jgi:outer membrane protein, multidrug efflux system
MRFPVIVSSSLLLTSCAVGPNYHRPAATELGAPAAWRATLPHEGSVAALLEWWKNFDDPALVSLVLAAENNNPTLANSLARVREARASVALSRASLWPSATGAGSVTRGKNIAGVSETPDGAAGIATLSAGSVDASWELDLFGGRRRAGQAAKARFESAEAEWHDARVTLAAEVADAYTTARQYQNFVRLYEQELASRRTSEHLVGRKIDEGLAPPTDALAVAASTAEASDRLERQRGLLAQTCNQLVLLTGLAYDHMEQILSQPGPIPRTNPSVALEMPAKAISQRPDVRSAERLLVAASSEIGVAIADALPSLTLAGSIGVNSTRANGTSSEVRVWSFGPALSIPIFQAGANSTRIEAARARYDQALATYRTSVLNSVREIEDALVRIKSSSRRLKHVQQAAESHAAYFIATERSYWEGRSSLLELETARRRSHAAHEALFSVELEQAHAAIALYKSLGGGWSVAPKMGTTGG